MLWNVRRAALAACIALLTACGSGNKGAARCSTTADCRAGFTCIAGDCLSAGQCPSAVTSCRTTAECPAQQECESGCCTPIQGCARSTDCTDPLRPHCDAGTSTCKACADSTQCAAGKVCAPDGSCETACGAGSDCKVATLPACYSTGGVSFCSQCAVNSDCKDPSAPMCVSGLCKGCTANSDCAAPTPACAPNHFCVTCVDAQDVDGVNPFCSGATRACKGDACVTCNPADNRANSTNGACPVAAPVCAAGSACVVCDVKSNKADGTNPACAAATPVCNANAACVACLVGSDCPVSGSYCSGANTCAQPQLVKFPDTGVSSGGQIALVATLDHAAVTDLSIGVAKANAADPGTLAASAIVIAAGQTSGSVAYQAGTTLTTQTVAIVATPLPANGSPRTSTVTVSALPPDLLALQGPGGTSDAQFVPAGGSLTITAELTVPATADLTLQLSLGAGAAGSVPATVTIPSGAISSTFTYVAGPAGATETVTASYALGAGAPTVKTLQVDTFKVTPVVTYVSATPLLPTGGTATINVALDAAPPVPVTVALAVQPANLGKLSAATVTFAAGSTTASVPANCPAGTCPPVFSACLPSDTPDCFADAANTRTPLAVVSATVTGGVKGSATIQVSPSLASIALVAADGVTPLGTPTAPIAQDSLTGANFVVALDTPAPAGNTEVFLNTFAEVNLTTRFKSRLPNSVVVKSGKSTATLAATSTDYPYPFLPCYHGSNSTDLTTLRATIPGIAASSGQRELDHVNITKFNAAVNVVCPLEPFDARRPANTPVIFTLSYTNASVPVDVVSSCGGSLNGGTPGSYSPGNAGTFITQFTLTPPTDFTGVCTVTATNHATPANVVSSRITFVAPHAATQATLLLNKLELDEAGADAAEFIEVYNAGPTVTLDGWTLIVISSRLATDSSNCKLTVTPQLTSGCSGDSIYANQVPKHEIVAFDLGAQVAGGLGKTLPTGHRLGIGDAAGPATGLDYYLLNPVPVTSPVQTQGNFPNAPAAYLLVDPGGNIVDSVNVGGPIFAATSAHVHGAVCAPGTDVTGVPCQFDLYQGILDGWVLDQPGSFSTTTTPPGAGVVNTLVRCRDGVSTGDQSLDWCQTASATLGVANTVTPAIGP